MAGIPETVSPQMQVPPRPTSSQAIKTLADLLDRLGGVSLERVRFRPFPGTATVQDLIDVQQREGKLCALVEGVLLAKTVGYAESSLALFLGSLLLAHVVPRNLGIVTGPDGTVELMANLVRIPDVAFTSWDRLPGRRRPDVPVPRVVPNLVVEILSQGNPPEEMAAKRREYLAAGVELVWEVDTQARTVTVSTSVTKITTVGVADRLEGGTVLPGFVLLVRDLFAEMDRQG